MSSYNAKMLKKINLAGKSAPSKSAIDSSAEVFDMMTDPRYLRQSSSLINEALQKGFDVLQLADGDIVTTGTKTVVYRYSWDQEKGKLVKAKTEPAKKQRKATMIEEEEDESEDAEA